MVTLMIELGDIKTARDRISEHIRRTPVLPVTNTSLPLGKGELFLKLECMQVTGSFKARGATNKFLTMPKEAVQNGIVTASGGNHGIAVARAATMAGVPATVFVPEAVTEEKIARLRQWGAQVVRRGEIWNDSNALALNFAKERDCAYFHPFADPAVVAGQGTTALEFLEDAPIPDVMVVAIGGGGLISGMSIALKALHPNVRIIGVEPTGSPTLKASLDAGRVVKLPEVTSRVATMSCGETDSGIFDLVQLHVDDVVLVDDGDILDACQWLWSELGIAADLSGAAAIAVLKSGKLRVEEGQKVAALICGAGSDGM
jgi:threonine dehydratase